MATKVVAKGNPAPEHHPCMQQSCFRASQVIVPTKNSQPAHGLETGQYVEGCMSQPCQEEGDSNSDMWRAMWNFEVFNQWLGSGVPA